MLSRAHLLFRTLIRPWLLLVYKTISPLADTNKSKLRPKDPKQQNTKKAGLPDNYNSILLLFE